MDMSRLAQHTSLFLFSSRLPELFITYWNFSFSITHLLTYLLIHAHSPAYLLAYDYLLS